VRTLASAREVWRVLFADIGEVYVFCPECAEREFGEEANER
jgi:hypothetical protein